MLHALAEVCFSLEVSVLICKYMYPFPVHFISVNDHCWPESCTC